MHSFVSKICILEDNSQIIISILKKILGNPKKDNVNEYEFNCKSRTCRNDKDKFNLAYNSKENIFHCWKCKYGGTVHRIADDYGSKEDAKRVYQLIPKKKFIKKQESPKEYSDTITCSLPEGFRPLKKKSNSKYYKAAVRYLLKDRKLSWDVIEKYNIGYTEREGNRRFRIVVPSYNKYNQVNYYVARAYFDLVKPNYMGPPKEEVKRTEIIFNYRNINFDLPVFLVEGVFDMFSVYNSIPMLGKEISEVIVKKLVEHKTRVVLCLDEDALYDSINIYNELTSLGLDVYFIEIKGDIDEYNKENGKLATIELLKTCRKLDFQYIFKKLALKEKKKNNKREFVDEKKLKQDWEILKKELLKDQ